ncbi:hypothetical protein Syun_002943 [Stephania yunnanensis]|uniref:Queuine tRNA-ribosyltransferase accessory subunit 2 n=1 Tax=Stephania yunnanensis TaxID=152371 RepID=A0AAP0Q3D2_9MAGN
MLSILNNLANRALAKTGEREAEAMKFGIKAWRNGGRERVGSLDLVNNNAAIETPALVLTTRKGLPTYISPDLLPSVASPDSCLLQASPLHFLDSASPKTISNIGGLHQLVSLHGYSFTAAPRDSILCLPEYESTNKMGASFETTCGRRLIKPAEYMELVSALNPNLWATLADEVPAWVSEKRNKTSVDRTVRWLDECIALDKVGSRNVLGAIVGGSSIEQRVRCAEEVTRRNVSGYWLGGFGLGETMEERPALLCAVTDILPTERPRQISGLDLPEEVLQGVASGIDLFDSTYIYHLTLGGYALTFPLNRNERRISDEGNDIKINLKATIYRKDTSPIIDDCRCYTCQNHTRAYINHLINVHEMLAQILLEIHNTHHYLGFFRAIREAIKEGEFDLFHENFVEIRHDHMTAVAANS